MAKDNDKKKPVNVSDVLGAPTAFVRAGGKVYLTVLGAELPPEAQEKLSKTLRDADNVRKARIAGGKASKVNEGAADLRAEVRRLGVRYLEEDVPRREWASRMARRLGISAQYARKIIRDEEKRAKS